ncbi:MAG: hypothetical protein RL463_993 [Bacteroidota bacterium]|jgi:hypothetical protein
MNEIKACVVKTDGSVNEVWAEWDYNQLSKEVGGFIEAVNFGDKPYFAYINEEGKMLCLPENKYATELWYRSGQRILIGDYLAGDVVFFGHVDIDGNNTSVPSEIFDEFKTLIKVNER